jgi:hypothetical protein
MLGRCNYRYISAIYCTHDIRYAMQFFKFLRYKFNPLFGYFSKTRGFKCIFIASQHFLTITDVVLFIIPYKFAIVDKVFPVANLVNVIATHVSTSMV